MPRIETKIKLSVALALLPALHLVAAPLKRAEVTQVINEVKVIDSAASERPAVANDVIEGKTGVRTGQKSRAELVFEDSTLTRLGANTIFNFENGSRNMDLGAGTIMLQVPKNAGGATIRTAAVTAAVTGTTILFEYTPGTKKPKLGSGKNVVPFEKNPVPTEKKSDAPKPGYIKAMVLEGHLRITLTTKLGESIVLGPGQMIIMTDDGEVLPEPVDFDIETVTFSSRLTDNRFWQGRKRQLEYPLIQEAIDDQVKRKDDGSLITTNLLINGRGTNVLFASVDDSRSNRANSNLPKSIPPDAPLLPEPTPTPTPAPVNTLPPAEITGTTDLFPGSLPGGRLRSQCDCQPYPIFYTGLGTVDTVARLQDFNGGETILPTAGRDFTVISNGGIDSMDGLELTGTNYARNISSKLVPPVTRAFLSLDYRFLTNEVGNVEFFSEGSGGASFGVRSNDSVTVLVEGDSGNSLRYEISAENFISESSQLAAFVKENVGGYVTGTNWLKLRLDLTPFIGDNVVFSIQVQDGPQSRDVDSAFAFDNFKLTQTPGSEANSNLIGAFTGDFKESIVFGTKSSEYLLPNVRGVENINSFGPGSDGGSLTLSSDFNLTVNSPILADSGPNKQSEAGPILPAGRGGNVSLNSVDGQVVVNSTIQVSSNDQTTGRVSSAGGNIQIQSQKGVSSNSAARNTGIVITDSGQLSALLDAAAEGSPGSINLSTNGSDIVVNGGKIIAERGTIDVRNSADGSQIRIGDPTSANKPEIRGDVVKIGALGNNGQVLIGGGQISADSILKIYAGGNNGSIIFRADTQLNGSSDKYLVANTVTVQNGVDVRVNGPTAAKVFTNNSNWSSATGGNGNTSGTFSGRGAEVHSPSVDTPPPFD